MVASVRRVRNAGNARAVHTPVHTRHRRYDPPVPHGVTTVEGVDRIRRKLEHNALLAEVHREVSTLLREAPRVEMSRAKLPGDSEALRGIPAVSKTSRGAIRNTDPEGETIRRMSRNSR
jgi:hypothetical protein